MGFDIKVQNSCIAPSVQILGLALKQSLEQFGAVFPMPSLKWFSKDPY